MSNVYHLSREFGNLSSLESLEITELLRRNTVWVIHISLINNKFRSELIPHLFLKLI